MAKTSSDSLFYPSNFLALVGLGLLRASALLPLRWSRAIGKGLGLFAATCFPYRRSVGDTNLKICFPEMSSDARRRLLRQHYVAIGMGIFEMAAAWYKPKGAFAPVATVRGLEHIDALRAAGKGALLLTAHSTTLELIGKILLDVQPFGCLYRKPNQPRIAREMTRMRQSEMEKVIHFDEMQVLIRALRTGHLIWYAPDQGKRLKYSDLIPFFGEPAVTNTATGRIARMGRAAVVPFYGYRDKQGHYQVEIFPPLDAFPSNDEKADALRINHLIEDFVRKAPEQYFWLHKRFKRRGPDLPDVYKRSRLPQKSAQVQTK
jgi:KDO2-lipid IV(A) lauroyltransferase